MSNIPTSAMPRAGDFKETEGQSQSFETSETSESGTAFGQIADKAREYPKTAIAAGAAVAAGVVAAATLTARSRKSGKNSKKD
jgi:hypothetical protein